MSENDLERPQKYLKRSKTGKAFTIWCIFYVRRDDENEKRFVNATISQPLDNYPQFAYDNGMLNHQVRQQPDRMSRGISRQTVNSCLYEWYMHHAFGIQE